MKIGDIVKLKKGCGNDTAIKILGTQKTSVLCVGENDAIFILTKEKNGTHSGIVCPCGEHNWRVNIGEYTAWVEVSDDDILCGCGDTDKKENSTLFNDEWYCENCANENLYTCCDCGDTVHSDNSHSFNDDTLCNNCYSDNYFWCENCDATRHVDDGADDGCVNCDESSEIKYRDFSKTSMAYCDEVKGKIITSTRTFGLELEMVNNDIENLKKLSNDLSSESGLTTDGSINGRYGIEIQTPILCGKKGEMALRKIVKKCKDLDFTVNNSCGTHVHFGMSDYLLPDREIKTLRLDTPHYRSGVNILFSVVRFTDEKNIPQNCEVYRFSRNTYTTDLCKENVIQENYDSVVGKSTPELVESFVELKDIAYGYTRHDNFYLCVYDDRVQTENEISFLNEFSVIVCERKVNTTSNFDLEKVKTLLYFYTAFDKLFLGMLSSERRKNTYCNPMTKNYTMSKIEKIESVEDLEKYWYATKNINDICQRKQGKDGSRYSGVNFHSMFSENKTLEVRFHEGTLDIEKMLYWVALHQKIIDSVSGGSITIGKIKEVEKTKTIIGMIKLFSNILSLSDEMLMYVKGRVNLYKTPKVKKITSENNTITNICVE